MLFKKSKAIGPLVLKTSSRILEEVSSLTTASLKISEFFDEGSLESKLPPLDMRTPREGAFLTP